MGTFRLFDTAIGERDVQMPTPPAGAAPPGGGPANQPVVICLVNTLSSDPGVGQDVTQGYVVGSQVFNNTANQLRFWTCRDNTAGAAKWVFEGADYTNGGTNPSNEITQFGGAPSAQLAEEGNVNRQISAAGSSPGATGVDSVLAVYSLPANAFDGVGNRGITVTAVGSFGATGNNKRVRLWFNPATAVVGQTIGAGGTLLADTGVVSTNGGGWWLGGNVFKYGAANSNTQMCTSNGAISAGTHNGVSAPVLSTAVENAPILFAVTGNATTATSDIVFNWLEINAMN